MNLFNCFQAVAFYIITPFLIQYLYSNGYTAWAVVAGVGEFVGFVAISFIISEHK